MCYLNKAYYGQNPPVLQHRFKASAIWSWWACLEVEIFKNWAMTCSPITTHWRPQESRVGLLISYGGPDNTTNSKVLLFFTLETKNERGTESCWQHCALWQENLEIYRSCYEFVFKSILSSQLFFHGGEVFLSLKGWTINKFIIFRSCRGLLLSLNWNKVLFFSSRKKVFLFKKEPI